MMKKHLDFDPGHVPAATQLEDAYLEKSRAGLAYRTGQKLRVDVDAKEKVESGRK